MGRVGAGKSSLLSAILGEMTKTDGSVTVRGTVAFCNQQPWIMGGTIRSNITFGFQHDQEFYDIVLDACALREDLAILPQGDAVRDFLFLSTSFRVLTSCLYIDSSRGERNQFGES